MTLLDSIGVGPRVITQLVKGLSMSNNRIKQVVDDDELCARIWLVLKSCVSFQYYIFLTETKKTFRDFQAVLRFLL